MYWSSLPINTVLHIIILGYGGGYFCLEPCINEFQYKILKLHGSLKNCPCTDIEKEAKN